MIDSRSIPQLSYQKITDDLLYMGDYLLKFNVDLAKADKDNNRVHFHHEYNYESTKYVGCPDLTTLKRDFRFYLSIEKYKREKGEPKLFIMILPQDMIELRYYLQECQDWFLSPKYHKLFMSRQGVMILTGDLGVQLNLYTGSGIYIEPTVVTIDAEKKQYSKGVKICFNSEENYTVLTYKQFFAFKYFIDSLNMYESACSLVNYIPQIPKGVNAITFAPDDDIDNRGSLQTNVKEREIPSQRQNQSFFAQVDKL